MSVYLEGSETVHEAALIMQKSVNAFIEALAMNAENQKRISEGKSIAYDETSFMKPSERCEHCGSTRIYHGPPDCPGCGAPNCCQTCCKVTTLLAQRDALLEACKSVIDDPKSGLLTFATFQKVMAAIASVQP